MKIKKLENDFCVCKVEDYSKVNFNDDFFFVGKTDEENSLVCSESSIPENAAHIDSGWKGFRIQGELDFSLVGILAKISTLLANNEIPIYAISTYNTDYILVKKEHFQNAISALESSKYEII